MSDDLALRRALIAQGRWMNANGLNQGASGNLSARHGAAMLITPSAIPYDRMTPEMIAEMKLEGGGAWEGPCKPSSEWRFHLDILRARPEIGAVVHTHSPHATALAIGGRAIPACHYMVLAFGGRDVRCAPYATFGTQALSEAALAALEGRSACLLAHHGMIALGRDLDQAMARAVELEALARQYLLALGLGAVPLLSEAQLIEAEAAFKTYRAR